MLEYTHSNGLVSLPFDSIKNADEYMVHHDASVCIGTFTRLVHTLCKDLRMSISFEQVTRRQRNDNIMKQPF